MIFITSFNLRGTFQTIYEERPHHFHTFLEFWIFNHLKMINTEFQHNRLLKHRPQKRKHFGIVKLLRLYTFQLFTKFHETTEALL